MINGYAWRFSFKFLQIGYRYTITWNTLQWDLMHKNQQLEEVLCEIFLNMFQWLLITYDQTSLVDGYGKNKHCAIISQDLIHFCFQEPILNHSL